MSSAALAPALPDEDGGLPHVRLRRAAPTIVAALPAIAYVVLSPPSEDLAAHLLRAKLFRTIGFGLWNNWWYSGHSTPGYSVTFPPLAALLTPQLVGAVSAVITAALFEMIARRHFGERAWVGSLWFGLGTAVDLYTGRLTFAFGLMFAVACVLALQRHRYGAAFALAVLTPLGSPVAALFVALAGAATAAQRGLPARQARPAIVPLLIAATALVPVLILSWVFPEGGSEPYSWQTLWPILLTCTLGLLALGRTQPGLSAGVLLYGLGNLAAYLLSTPIGSNASRLEPLLAGPLAAIVLWPRHRRLLVLLVVPLLYVQWQAPYFDVSLVANNDQAEDASYYQPLLSLLSRQPGQPFRIEIPFTAFHWEAYQVAPEFPLARGWERQLDIADNPIFYGGRLDAATYRRWLDANAVRYVAVAHTRLDYSAHREVQLISAGLPYLHQIMRSKNWTVYAVSDPTPIVSGAARLTALGPDELSLTATRPGTAYVRVHYSSYWKLNGVHGCVAPDGAYMRVSFRSAGRAQLRMDFALDRVAAHSPRCS